MNEKGGGRCQRADLDTSEHLDTSENNEMVRDDQNNNEGKGGRRVASPDMLTLELIKTSKPEKQEALENKVKRHSAKRNKRVTADMRIDSPISNTNGWFETALK